MKNLYQNFKNYSLFFLLLFSFVNVQSQSAGFNSTFIILSLNGGSDTYYDLQANTSNPDFQSATLGNFGPNNSLLLKGAEHNVYKCGSCDLSFTRLNYRIYPTGSASGTYSNINVPYSSGGNNGCGGQDQQWRTFSNSINLLSSITAAGNYTIEVFSDATTTCGNAFASNSGNNYKATFNYFTSTIWNGTSWSNGVPTSTIDAIIDGTFTTTASGVTAGFTAKSLTVNSTKSLTINTGHNVTVAGAVTNNGTFTVENNANLVQTNTSATNTGSIIVKKNSASINLHDYTLWSSPVAGQKLKAFSPNTLDTRFYTYDSSTNLYNTVSAPSTTDFATATGYLIRADNTWTASTPTTYNGTFTGTPNNGTITLSGLTANKFYAVGNPYPSTISSSLFFSGNTTGGTLYFWRKTNGASGTAYATKTSAGATASGGYTPSNDIAIGQGFIVKTGSSTTTLSFTNTMRTSNNSSVFLRSNDERNRYWLNLTNTIGHSSQMLVAYMPGATAGYDNAIDGRYINDAPVSLTSLINDEEYTIQGRALPFSTTDTVPLGFKTDITGNYTIAIDHVDGFFSTNQSIYLKDNLLSTVVDLNAGSYSFASAIGTFNSRFEVVYQSTLGVTNPSFTANSVIAYNANGVININSGSTVMNHIKIYDLQGRLLVKKNQINATETSVTLAAGNQLLLIEITAANGNRIIKKIIQ